MDRRATVEFAIPSICLMENAGAGSARIAAEMLGGAGRRVLCVCGPGGNGGDGAVVARHLAIEGHSVRIALLAEGELRGDAGIQMTACRALSLPLVRIGSSGLRVADVFESSGRPDLVVDALYGTGIDRALDGLAAETVAGIARLGAPVLSLDLPSGLDCDTGEPLGACVRADVTATFVAPKVGFLNPRSRAWTGEVRIVGIGAPAAWPLDA